VCFRGNVLAADGAWSGTLEDGACYSLFPRKRHAESIAAWPSWRKGDQALSIGRCAHGIPPTVRLSTAIESTLRGAGASQYSRDSPIGSRLAFIPLALT
jgi:hypothetical protein